MLVCSHSSVLLPRSRAHETLHMDEAFTGGSIVKPWIPDGTAVAKTRYMVWTPILLGLVDFVYRYAIDFIPYFSYDLRLSSYSALSDVERCI